MNFTSISTKVATFRWVLVAFLLLALIIIPFVLFETLLNDQIEQLQSELSSPAALFTLVTSALALDVFLPIPSSVVNIWAGAELGLFQGALSAWLGLSLGSILAYEMARRLGRKALRGFVGEFQYERAQAFNRSYGLFALALLRPVPVLAEASVFWAGIAEIQRPRFLLIVIPANLGIAATYALVGTYATDFNSFLAAFAFALVLPGVTMLAARKASSVTEKTSSGTENQHLQIEYDYPLRYTENTFDPNNHTLLEIVCGKGQVSRICVCVDQGVLESWPNLFSSIQGYVRHHCNELQLAGGIVAIPGGEVCKSDPQVLNDIYKNLQEQGMDRHSYILAIGGGAVLDVVGYAAATAHRGIRLIRMPTTVLAQNDAGIGVKNGVNLAGQKNYLGSFAPPHAVINDSIFLQTLSERDKRAGMAEAIKVALIRDAEYFVWLEANADALSSFNPDVLAQMIRRCAHLHLRQITSGGDPFERGSARPLDFGHWAAHRLETLSDYQLRHGEAVAIGIALDTRYSFLSGHLKAGVDERVSTLLQNLGFALWHKVLDIEDTQARHPLLQGLCEFQEHLGGKLTISLLSDAGNEHIVHDMDEDLILASMDWLKQQHPS